jgi:hypothetical protein
LTDQTVTRRIHFLGLEKQLIRHSAFLKLQIQFADFFAVLELAEGLLPFKKAVMNTWELAVAFLFSRSFLKWAPLGFRRFIFDEGN